MNTTVATGGLAPPLDEVVVGVVEDAKHQMLSVCALSRATEPQQVERAHDEDRAEERGA